MTISSKIDPAMKNTQKTTRNAGFALVVTLSLMILLTVIAVGLLSLSSISLRSTSQGSAQALAQSNARMAMMLALGELQKSMGPDTAVSAPASSVLSSPPRPHLVGAWQRPENSAEWAKWRWTPGSGQPDYSSKASLFRGWLVSTVDPKAALDPAVPSTALAAGDDAVVLVGGTTPAKEVTNNGVSTNVVAQKVKIGKAGSAGASTISGKYAWSVSDESTKAPIHLADRTDTLTQGERTASQLIANRVRADVLSPKLEPSLAKPVNLISLETAVIPGGATSRDEFRKRFHDFTTQSLGLLTNTATGGLKTDLTSIFEEPGTSIPANAFDAANSVTPYAYPATNPTAAGAVKWNYLRDHYRKFLEVTKTTYGMTYKPANNATKFDLKVNTTGITPSPDTERLLPVIAKFQMYFSVVAHYPYLKGRRDKLNEIGVPVGWQNFGVPNLVFDPIITLYNPYDVALDMTRIRIRIWDPPVGFRFRKVDKQKGTTVLFRPGDLENGDGKFRGLANFRYDTETSTTNRKCITLILTNGTPAASGATLKLLPGEVKVYSPRVETNWTWTMEAGDGSTDSYPTRSFFDWGSNNYSNVDGRTASGIGMFGVETVPGWDTRAGFQTDHLSNGGRDQTTLYDFEKIAGANPGGFMNIRLTDDVIVEAKPLVTKGNATKSFQVDILAGTTQGSVDEASVTGDTNNSGVQSDRLRSYSFNFLSASDPSAELNVKGAPPFISKKFNIKDILQGPAGETGKKKPFAMLEMSARTTKDETTDSKPWLYNNPVTDGATQVSSKVGLTTQSYDLRFMQKNSFIGFPDAVEVDPVTKRGYFGASGSTQDGSSFVQMMHVPVAPMASLGGLVYSNLVSGSQLPRVMHPFGNSRAHPLIPTTGVFPPADPTMLDHSYLLNDGLWDGYYFSTVANYTTGKGVIDSSKTREEVLKGIFDGTKPGLNSRLVPVTSSGDPATRAGELNALAAVPRSRQLAKHLAVSGAFNLSSTSVDAWRSVLSSLRDREIKGSKIGGTAAAPTVTDSTYTNDKLTPFLRTSTPLADSTESSSIRWAAYRALNDDQINELAKSIVTEITNRGKADKAPAFSLGEFVNRRLGSPAELHTLAGLLQTAIDKVPSINKDSSARDNIPGGLSAAAIPKERKAGVATPEALDGLSCEGSPSMFTQGDLMTALAPIATVRGDTFKIRSYGEATSPDGKTVLARAWCETIVQRVPEFVDPADAPEVRPADLASKTNKTFGRRFNIVSYRWLNDAAL